MDKELTLSDLKGVIRRRKNILVYSFLLIFVSCTIVAFVLPSIYKSQVTITVEDQEIHKKYVQTASPGFVSERLRLLEKKLLNYSQLSDIISKFDLYPELETNTDKVSKIREDITFDTVDISTYERSIRGGWLTIAFTLAYENKNPEKAQAVTNLLGNLFINQDRSDREQQASTTTNFLENELKELQLKVKQNEEKLSRFKAANIDQLPGSTKIFQERVYRLDQQISDIDTRIRTLREKIVYLNSQIANIDPLVPIITDKGKVSANPNNRLKYLRLQLIQLQSQVSDKHPDVIRLKSEIKELEAQAGIGDVTSEKVNRLNLVEKQLAELKGKYGDKHPDVVKLTREAELLKRQIATAKPPKTIEEERSDNPGYMNIKAQIIVAETEIQALKDKRAEIVTKLEEYQKKLEVAPFIDEEYNKLTLDFENAKKKYNEVADMLHEARLSQQLDTSEQGARFLMNAPAFLPSKPYKPKRLLIILIGLVLGIGCAVTLAAVSEALDKSIKTTDELEKTAGIPVLAAVSFLDSPLEKRMRRTRRLLVVTGATAIILLLSLIINWFVMPIDDLWAKFENRLVEIGLPIDRKS